MVQVIHPHSVAFTYNSRLSTKWVTQQFWVMLGTFSNWIQSPEGLLRLHGSAKGVVESPTLFKIQGKLVF